MLKDGNADTRDVISYGIASVYTPTLHRGKGFARTILQLVHYLIAPGSLLPSFPAKWGPKPTIGPMDGDFSVLYSGIGDKYYATCRQGEGVTSKEGWIRQPVTTRTWDVAGVDCPTPDEAGWLWLGADELGDLEEKAAFSVKKRMDTKEDACNFAILPNWQVCWFRFSLRS